jgi:hypothetical protein
MISFNRICREDAELCLAHYQNEVTKESLDHIYTDVQEVDWDTFCNRLYEYMLLKPEIQGQVNVLGVIVGAELDYM